MSLSSFQWQLGGLSPLWGWSLLAACAVLGIVGIVLLYRHTLRNLSRRQRLTLAALRTGVLLALLLCLANPSKVEKSPRTVPPDRALAVIVDRSASMETEDNRSETRLANALRIWKRHAAEAGELFGKVEHFRFSNRLESSGTFEEVTAPAKPGASTRLYEALQEAIANRPSSIVCLTDGLDTTGQQAAALLAAAQSQAVPLYFVVGKNRTQPKEFLSIREIHTPARVLRQSDFNPSAVVEITSSRVGEIPLELWSGSRKLAETMLPVRPGMNTLPWAPKILAGEAGPFPLEFRLGTSGKQETASATTQVVERTEVDILYYQGALQWGFPYLVAALKKDPSFNVTSILNPSLGVRMTKTSRSGAAPAHQDLPQTVEELKKYRIVILAHVFADQLSPLRQQALVDYAKGGGSVLFIAPGTEAASQFAGTRLEQMLPVIFERPVGKSSEDGAAERFQNLLNRIGGANAQEDTNFAERVARQQQPAAPLRPFVAGPGGSRAVAGLFEGRGENVPKYSDFASVKTWKPGAEVLAVHAQAAPGTAARVLLARQPFGAGWTATLATDLLWRWKMSLPSTSHAVEKFWQQLMLSLAPMPGQGLRLVKTSGPATVYRPVTLRMEGAQTAPTLTQSNGKETSPVPVREAEGAEGKAWEAVFAPTSAGRLECIARDASGNEAKITMQVAATAQNLEMSNLPADVEGLRRLAEATGGALIGDEPVFRQVKDALEDFSQPERVRPLWNSSWLLGLLLALYAVELITRRTMKLL